MKQKKPYERPRTRAIELQQARMLADSPVGAKSSINKWGNGGTTDEDIYM